MSNRPHNRPGAVDLGTTNGHAAAERTTIVAPDGAKFVGPFHVQAAIPDPLGPLGGSPQGCNLEVVVCVPCGALVMDLERHLLHHEALDGLAEWAAAHAEVADEVPAEVVEAARKAREALGSPHPGPMDFDRPPPTTVETGTAVIDTERGETTPE